MKRKFLKVTGIQLKSFERLPPIPGKNNVHRACFSLILEGCIAMNNIYIEIDGFKMSGEEREYICHNDAMADAKFLDYPINHLGKKKLPEHFLYEYIAFGMNEFLNQRNYDDVREFLEGKKNSLDDSGFFKPSTWRDTLKIPVEFIRIYGISGHHGIAIANLMIGHHIWLEGVQIYPTFKPEGRIFDKGIIVEIERLLSKKSVRDDIGYYARTSTFDWSKKDELLAAIPGCDQRKIPPIRFY